MSNEQNDELIETSKQAADERMQELNIEFAQKTAEIQQISTGDIPIENANPELLRNLAQAQAIRNSQAVVAVLNTFLDK